MIWKQISRNNVKMVRICIRCIMQGLGNLLNRKYVFQFLVYVVCVFVFLGECLKVIEMQGCCYLIVFEYQ